MKLVIIYGPPAVGKLTVAKQLEKITGFKLFHNHLTNDLVESIFDFGTKPFFKYTGKFRLELFEAAAKHNIPGLIFTFCYAHGADDNFIKRIVNRIKKQNGEILFVQLLCSDRALFRRVKGASRENFGKLNSRKGLKKCLETWDFVTPIPKVNTLKINNTKLSPRKTAEKIKKHFRL